MSNKKSEGQEELSQHRQSGDSPMEVAGSPGSYSTSSSTRQERIVELLQEVLDVEDQQLDWTISREFYEEDVAQNSDNMSGDETEDGDDEDQSLDIHIHESDLDEDDEDENDGGDDDDDDEDEEADEDDAHLYLFHNVHGQDEDFELDGVIEGFVVEPGPDDQSSTDGEEQDEDLTANYDTSLPVVHSYLGDNMDECRGRQVLVEGSVATMPLFNLKHVVLLPGQALPITSSNLNFRIEMCLKSCIRLGRTTIGMMSAPHINPIGTTAEIRNASTVGDLVRIIVEGRQRFKLLSPPFESVTEGQIRILPEVMLSHPYPRIPSLSRFLIGKNIPDKFIISKHPRWLLRSYEARYVMAKIMEQIQHWCSTDLTRDPNDFSYWVAANLPISNEERKKALSFNCAEARLLWLLDMLEKSEYFGCAACKNVICFKRDVFPMSRSGPQCSFVNSGGYIHDTLTVRNAQGLIQEYGWERDYSWFPGYAWRMAHCNQCNRHIGWCYKSVVADTKPKKFYGLSRVNVRLQAKPKPEITGLQC